MRILTKARRIVDEMRAKTFAVVQLQFLDQRPARPTLRM